MNRNRIENIKQWLGRVFGIAFAVGMCVLTVAAVKEQSYALACTFVFFIAMLVVCYVHDEMSYAKWNKDNGNEGTDDGSESK